MSWTSRHARGRSEAAAATAHEAARELLYLLAEAQPSKLARGRVRLDPVRVDELIALAEARAHAEAGPDGRCGHRTRQVVSACSAVREVMYKAKRVPFRSELVQVPRADVEGLVTGLRIAGA